FGELFCSVAVRRRALFAKQTVVEQEIRVADLSLSACQLKKGLSHKGKVRQPLKNIFTKF
ncbi:MAG: hypothetical protein IJD45_07560, partial [Clostridia bacterium]|nr:hypothetical protein [Clostridia bacterium]